MYTTVVAEIIQGTIDGGLPEMPGLGWLAEKNIGGGGSVCGFDPGGTSLQLRCYPEKNTFVGSVMLWKPPKPPNPLFGFRSYVIF
jgi:hypothetical protein